MEINKDDETKLHKVYVLFDIPHVFKALRNNLIKYDLEYEDKDGVKRVASWSHTVEAFFRNDKQPLSLMPKITYKHIRPTSFQKMKVKVLID